MPMGGGGSSGGGQTTQTIQKSDPWSGQQPYLTDIFKQAQDTSKNEMPFYPGQTYTPFSPESQLAQAWQDYRAMSGSPVTTAGQQQLTDTLGGGYLYAGNPYFSNMVSNIQSSIQPGIDAKFSGAGRYGSGAHEGALDSAMAQAVGQLAYQNYDAERQNQMKSMLFAPQMAQQDYYDIAKLAEVGGIKEDQTQKAINEAMARYQSGQLEPWQRLGLYSNLVQGNYGGQSTGSSTTNAALPSGNLGSQILGGAAGLGGLALGLSQLLPVLGLSDKRSKENIKSTDTKGLLNMVVKLDPVTFDYKPEFGKKGQIGFVADEMEKVAPGMVVKGDDGYRRIMPHALLGPLVGAIKEQQKQIEELRRG